MSSPHSSGKSRDGGQRSKRKSKAANGWSHESDDFYLQSDPTFEPSSPNISQEDLVSFESDLAPLLGEATAMKRDIVTGLGKWDDLMQEITKALQSRIHVVKGASDTWGRDEEQSKKITELEDLNKKLLLRYGDIEGESKAKRAVLEQKINRLESEKRELEEMSEKKYKQEYDDRIKVAEEKEKQMDADHRKEKKRHEAEKAEFRVELEAEKKKEIDGMKGRIAELEEKVKSLSDQNIKQKTELTKQKDSTEMLNRAYKELQRENALTGNKMEALLEEFQLSEKPDQYFSQQLEHLDALLTTISVDYFTDLPLAFANPVNAYLHLTEQSCLFNITPMADSDISITLRRANVQNVIIRMICDRLWKPLFCEPLWKHQNAQLYLDDISLAVDSTGLRRESLWRHTTLESTEKGFGKTVMRDEILKSLTDDVLAKLRPLIEPSQSHDLGKELQSLFYIAIDFWCDAQRDGSRIRTVIKPNKAHADRWTEALPEFPAEDAAELSSPSHADGKDYSALLLFPTVTRVSISNSSLNAERQLLDEETRVLFKGRALFPDTAIFSQGAQEKAEMEQAIKLISRTRRTSGSKRNSVASSAAKQPMLR